MGIVFSYLNDTEPITHEPTQPIRTTPPIETPIIERKSYADVVKSSCVK